MQQQLTPRENTGSAIGTGVALVHRLKLPGPFLPVLSAHILIAVVLIYSLAFATHFTYRFEPIRFMNHYLYLANGFAHFHVYGADTKGNAIPTGCIDCLNYHGKVYYPYGPVPALIQLALINVLKLRVTAGAIVWGICAISLYAMFWITRWYAAKVLQLRQGDAVYAAAAAVAVIATTDIFLHTSTVPYSWSQASAAGQLFNLLSAFLLILAVHSKKPKYILWSGVLCGLSFLCKQNYLPACLAGCALLLWTSRHGRMSFLQKIRPVLLFAAPVAISMGVLLLYNYARFGNPLDTGFPYLNASDVHPERYQMPQPHRIPYNFYNHFLAGVQVRTSDFPFVLGKSSAFGGINHKDGSGGFLHNFPIFSVFISMPLLLLLIPAVPYAVTLAVRKRASPAWEYLLYLTALWCCVFAYFLNESGSFMRYEYDMPFLLGLCVLQVIIFMWRAAGRIPEPWQRKSVRACFGVALALCFIEQAAIGADQTAGLILSRTDKFILWQAAERKSDIPLQRRAQVIREALFSKQIPYDVEDSQRFPFSITLPEHPGERSEPLVQFGNTPGASDMLGVRYQGGGQIRLLLDHWGAPLCVSRPLLPSAAREQLIEAFVDGVNGRTVVRLNGSIAMDCRSSVFSDAAQTALAGRNTLGFTTVGSKFSGSIVEIP